MVSKSIVKLIDEAILPALLLAVAKISGIFFTAALFSLDYEVKTQGVLNILPTVYFKNLDHYIISESYSNLAMFSAAALGTILIVVRSHLFHESHIHPSLQTRLAKLNLESLISPSYHLYHQGFIWLIFLWLTVGFLAVSSLIGITYVWLTVISLFVAINLSWIFALDVEKEIEINKT